MLVRLEMLDGRKWTTIARPSQPWVEIAASQSWWEVMGTYIVEGIRHILFGADHMLFVLGLLLIVKNRWMLLKTVTAFTVAHSITLAIATLGYAEAPVLPLNAAIALSILFLGPEIVKQNDARGGIRDAGCKVHDTRFEIRDTESRIRISHLESPSRTSHPPSRDSNPASLTVRYPWVVAFAFGLLHGFGFASALTSAGLPRSELPLALVSFNVGVEVGQLGFVALVLAMERSFRRARNPLAALGAGASRIYGRLARSVLDDSESGDDGWGMIRDTGDGIRDARCEIRTIRVRMRDSRYSHLASRIPNLESDSFEAL